MRRPGLLQHQLDEVDYTVIDFETTGLSPASSDRVCEIGAVKLRGGAVVDTLSTLIDPQRPISAGAYAVNGISPRMLAGAPIFSQIAERLLTLIKDCVLVAYNAPFDMSFLLSEFKLSGYPTITNPAVDALSLARQLLPGLGKYPQENVARLMGIPFPVKHRALEDAMVTSRLFMMFASMLKAHGYTHVSDLTRRDLGTGLTKKRLAIVHEALAKKYDLWIKYLSPTSFEISDRIVSPIECLSGNRGRSTGTYLIGFCHSANGERNFQIDRILDLRLVHRSTSSVVSQKFL